MQHSRQEPRLAELLLDTLLLFLLTALLIAPLFRAGYLDQWQSIESTFIADARFLIAHWPHPQWQPLWYTGTRFDYIYPPMLRYGTALIAMAGGYEPVRAYHIYIAFFYCLGIASVYVLVRTARQPRGMAWLAAAMTGLMSPSYLILKSYRHDSFRLAPHRLGVLVGWGEGPHMSALALIPLALAFAWRALEQRRRTDVVLAAILSAAVVSTNFYGAVALAIFYPIQVWSFWVTRRDARVTAPVIAIPVLAYGLTAFWLVPSYIRITAENMKYVASPGSAWAAALTAAVAGAFAFATYRLTRGRAEQTWTVFVAGCVIFFSLNVAGNYFFNFRITGEPHRWVPELDLVLILAGITVLRWLWNYPRGRVPRAVAIAVVAVSFITARSYVRHAWQIFRPAPDYRSRVEYRISDWIWKNRPTARTQTAGSVRFWFDVWKDLPELGGGSDQGVINGRPMDAQWEVRLGPQPETSILWMQCLGVDAIYESGLGSEEIYKDDRFPEKFAGVLPAIYNDHRGNVIYEVPRRYRVRARVVETQRLEALQTPQGSADTPNLRAYAAVVENGPDAPVQLVHEGSDTMRVRARIARGESIVVQETYDPAWHAWSGSEPLRVRKDAMGFLVVEAPPGDQAIRVEFVTPLENWIGRVVTLVSILLLAILWAGEVRTARKRKLCSIGAGNQMRGGPLQGPLNSGRGPGRPRNA